MWKKKVWAMLKKREKEENIHAKKHERKEMHAKSMKKREKK